MRSKLNVTRADTFLIPTHDSWSRLSICFISARRLLPQNYDGDKSALRTLRGGGVYLLLASRLKSVRLWSFLASAISPPHWGIPGWRRVISPRWRARVSLKDYSHPVSDCLNTCKLSRGIHRGTQKHTNPSTDGRRDRRDESGRRRTQRDVLETDVTPPPLRFDSGPDSIRFNAVTCWKIYVDVSNTMMEK